MDRVHIEFCVCWIIKASICVPYCNITFIISYKKVLWSSVSIVLYILSAFSSYHNQVCYRVCVFFGLQIRIFTWIFRDLLLLHSFIIYVNNKKYNLHLWFWGGDLIYRVSKFPLTQMKGVTGITYAILSERLLTVLLCDNLVKCLSLCSNKLFVIITRTGCSSQKVY